MPMWLRIVPEVGSVGPLQVSGGRRTAHEEGFSLPAPTDFATLPRIERAPSEVRMAFCVACGQEVGTASFCPKCGASQTAAAATAGAGASAAAVQAAPTEGIQENIAGLLCYLFGWISGL